MGPVYLFSLASQKTDWLAARQAAIAGNVANANTPGYKSKDVVAFSDVLDKTGLTLASTNPSHIAFETSGAIATKANSGAWEVTEDGNSAGIEESMLKAGEVNREYALTTNIVKSFHAMLMASIKS